MSNNQNHPYHLVEMSPWPLIGAISTMLTLMGLIKFLQQSSTLILMMGTTMTLLAMVQWWRDVIREETYQGLHTKMVIKGLKWGMILFIISEVFFLFHSF